MDKLIYKSLVLLGLNQKEIRFFETSFRLGPTTISQIAQKAHLQRSTAYLIGQNLLGKGFLEEDLKSYKKKVFAIDPGKLLRMVSARQRILRRQELELEESLPNLQALYSVSEIRPKVKVFEENQGLLRVWKDILSTRDEILIWTNQQTDKLVFGQQKHISFIEERAKKGIRARVLAVDNNGGQVLKQLDDEYLRETKILPQETNFSAEIYIYDSKIAILDYNQDIIGVIIESGPITNSHRAIFEMTWRSLDNK